MPTDELTISPNPTYFPAPQVLTSDEVGGGLRQLKAYPMLANERFKSLQKRGLIEPRRPAAPRGPKRVVGAPAAVWDDLVCSAVAVGHQRGRVTA